MSLAMAQVVRSPPYPSCPLHQGDVAAGEGGSQRQCGSEKTLCVRPCQSASTCELNVGSLEALGLFTWSRTEAPSPSPARPSAHTRRESLLELAPGWG